MTAKLLNKLIGVGVPPEVAEKLDDRYDALATKTHFIPAGIGSVGATPGFTNASDTGEVACPASQTAATFTIPLTGLCVGDVVSAGAVYAQIESAGNTATLDCDFRKLTNAAGDPTDASIGAITQVSATSDTAVSSSKTFTTSETVAAGEMLYALVTVTTAASTDVRLLGVTVSVVRAQE